MKRILFSVLILFTLHTVPALARSSNTQSEEHLPLPKDLFFIGNKVKVQNPAWFANLFDLMKLSCPSLLSPQNEAGTIEVYAMGPEDLSLQFHGQSSKLIKKSKTTYVPVHYEGDKVIQPYFLVEVPDWVKFHVEIDSAKGEKILRFFLLKGRPGSESRLPIFSAKGI